MKIDAHQHFWHYSPLTHPWISDRMSVLKRDFLPRDLSALLDNQDIAGSVAVQAAQSEQETLFLLTLADKYPSIKGVVGWVDLQLPRVEERLEYFSRYPLLKGFRHIVQDEPDNNFLLRDSFLNGLSRLHRYNYTYDILIYPRQLPAAIALVAQLPEQKFVLDHIAKPPIKAGEFEPWALQIEQLAQNQNVCCKVSGLITEADWDHWEQADLQIYLEHIAVCFGFDRIMFGSDWPVCLLAGSYHQVAEVFNSFVNDLSDRQKALAWGGNAMNFYGLS